MKRFLSFFHKEFLHILRDKRTLTVLFGLPVVQVVLFGFAITNEIKDAKIAIMDNSHDYITQQITNKILASDFFVLDRVLNSELEIEKAFQAGQVKLVVEFGADFAKNFEQGDASVKLIADATDPNTGATLINYVSAILDQYTRQRSMALTTPTLGVETRMWYNPELKGVYYFIPGVITIILMLVSAMLTSISIAREKELGTMEVLLSSPMQPAQVILAKVLPYMILSFINASFILLLGNLVFGLPMAGSIVLLLGSTLLFIAVALSLGVLISTRVDTQQVALMISLFVLMLPTILLSGFIFPVENMPWILQMLSNIIPAKWYVIILKDVMLKGNGLEMIWDELLILVAFVVVFIGASIRNFKVRLE